MAWVGSVFSGRVTFFFFFFFLRLWQSLFFSSFFLAGRDSRVGGFEFWASVCFGTLSKYPLSIDIIKWDVQVHSFLAGYRRALFYFFFTVECMPRDPFSVLQLAGLTYLFFFFIDDERSTRYFLFGATCHSLSFIWQCRTWWTSAGWGFLACLNSHSCAGFNDPSRTSRMGSLTKDIFSFG